MTRDEAIKLRAKMENTFSLASVSMTSDQIIENRALCATWEEGEHLVDEVRTVDGYPFKCRQEHDTATYPDIVPSGSAWATFWIPFHGTSAETALPFVQPTGAHDMYLADEYAVFDAGMKKCIRDTAYNYIDDPTAWEDA